MQLSKYQRIFTGSRLVEFMHLRRGCLPKQRHMFDLMSLAEMSETCDFFFSGLGTLGFQHGIANT